MRESVFETWKREQPTGEIWRRFHENAVIHGIWTAAPFVLVCVVVLLVASLARADAEWQKGSSVVTKLQMWGGANYTPDADVISPSLFTGQCETLTVACWGADLTGLLQHCNGRYEYNASLNKLQCNDFNLTAMDCAATPTGWTDIEAPEWVRISAINNSDSAQFFRVFCNGN